MGNTVTGDAFCSMNGEVTADINLLSTAQPKNFFFEQAFNNAISAHRCQRLSAGMNKSLELGFKAELLRPLAGGILPFNALHTQSKNLQRSFIWIDSRCHKSPTQLWDHGSSQ